jgi:hypothetical protein
MRDLQLRRISILINGTMAKKDCLSTEMFYMYHFVLTKFKKIFYENNCANADIISLCF